MPFIYAIVPLSLCPSEDIRSRSCATACTAVAWCWTRASVRSCVARARPKWVLVDDSDAEIAAVGGGVVLGLAWL